MTCHSEGNSTCRLPAMYMYLHTDSDTHTHTCNHTHMFTQIVIMHRQKQVMRSWLCVVVVYWFDCCNNIPPLTRAIYYVLLIQLDPATVWLHEESPGNRAFFPDPQNTRFLLNDDVGILITDLVAMAPLFKPHHPLHLFP